MEYPTIEQINIADRFTLCKWYRFLPCAETEKEIELINLINDKLKLAGGFTPEISKSLGWNQ